MKTQFTPVEIMSGRGCYSKERVNYLSFIQNKQPIISIQTILESEISIKDKQWFVFNNCKLYLKEKMSLSLKLVWAVLPIYEDKYPNDFRIRELLQAIEDFNQGRISKDILLEKKQAAYAAAADYAAADAAAAAAAAADNGTYSRKLQQIMIEFAKKIESWIKKS